MSQRNMIIEPDGLAPAVGYSHAVLAAPGRIVCIAGEIAFDKDGRLVGQTWAEQFDVALGNVVTALGAAGGLPQDVVAMQIFTTDVGAYRAARPALGDVYRRHMGRHYPAMGLYGVTELVDVGALVEISATAVIPD